MHNFQPVCTEDFPLFLALSSCHLIWFILDWIGSNQWAVGLLKQEKVLTDSHPTLWQQSSQDHALLQDVPAGLRACQQFFKEHSEGRMLYMATSLSRLSERQKQNLEKPWLDYLVQPWRDYAGAVEALYVFPQFFI